MSERDDEIQALWAEQTTLPLEVDMRKIVLEARKFESGIRRRNAIEIGTAVVVAVVFASYVTVFEHWLARVGAIGVVAGAGFVAWMLVRRGRVAPLPADHATAAFLAAYRDGLLRQARLLAWAPVWYVLPLLVPAAVFVAGIQAQIHGVASLPESTALLLGGVGAAISALNLYAARRMRRMAAALG